MSNCIEFMMKEDRPQNQAVAICYSERRRRKKNISKALEQHFSK